MFYLPVNQLHGFCACKNNKYSLLPMCKRTFLETLNLKKFIVFYTKNFFFFVDHQNSLKKKNVYNTIIIISAGYRLCF